uniref:Thyrotropin subunit beta n=1 Tax=Eptatretus burgeri TaxID=7764 RepID=A0A8C4Q4T1_EPTBU
MFALHFVSTVVVLLSCFCCLYNCIRVLPCLIAYVLYYNKCPCVNLFSVFPGLQERNIDSPSLPQMQQACVYSDVVYRALNLSSCRLDVSPLVYYPMALSCSCSQCNSTSTDCMHSSENTPMDFTACTINRRFFITSS